MSFCERTNYRSFSNHLVVPARMGEGTLEILEQLALSLTTDSRGELLSLAIIEDEAQYEQVKAFRLQNYQGDYVAKLINVDGSDLHDGHSAIFGAWLGHRLVATARLTSWPFELSSYIGET